MTASQSLGFEGGGDVKGSQEKVNHRGVNKDSGSPKGFTNLISASSSIQVLTET